MTAAFHRLTLAERKLDEKKGSPLEGSFDAWEGRNEAFHAALESACRSQLTLKFIAMLYGQSARYRRLAVRVRRLKLSTRNDTQAEHEALKDAALKRDRKRAVKLMTQHIQTSYDFVAKLSPTVFG